MGGVVTHLKKAARAFLREQFDKGGAIFVKNPKNGFPGVPCPFYLRGGFCAGVRVITGALEPPWMEPVFSKSRSEGLLSAHGAKQARWRHFRMATRRIAEK